MKDKIHIKKADLAINPIHWNSLTTSDVQSQGGAPLRDPWKDRGHSGLPAYHVLFPGLPGVKDMIISDGAQKGDLSTVRSDNGKDVVMKKQKRGFYDPVRDVQPSSEAPAAPEATEPGDPWFDAGDNGREVYPSAKDVKKDQFKEKVEKIFQTLKSSNPQANDAELLAEAERQASQEIDEESPKDVILNSQMADPSAGNLQGSTNINMIGQVKAQPLRKPTDLDKHLVANHFVEFNPTLYPIDEIKTLHIQLHETGQAMDHNPEVLKVAAIQHILGDKEEELNFLPKIGELQEFPPAPGAEGNSFVPWSIGETDPNRTLRGQ